MNIQLNQKAPEINLPDQDGNQHKLSDYIGKWVLVYFYPQDDTSGCTTEACGLRDNFPELNKIDAVVLGISPDSVESHKQFAEKYKLPFTLLADVEKKTINDYGVWDGRLLRTSFLINPGGEIVKIYETVQPEAHADEVVKDLKELQSK